MATNFLQIKLLGRSLRLVFLLTATILLSACISSQPYPTGVSVVQPIPTPPVRAPKVGQEWVYNIRNVFNQEVVDVVTERIVSVGEQIRIQRVGAKAGPLPDEIQGPWGYVIQDPHWTPPQQFVKPVPLWPEQLSAGWKLFYTTGYQVLGYPDGTYYWSANLSANQWELMKTPAGEFLTLQFHNQIPSFQSNDIFRIGNTRDEELWFSPEIGRWVIRRSFGRYVTNGVYWGNAYWEDYLQWELVSWK
ncbi:hypothetical protein [Polynucleobacter sp. Latsch14-2]|uniref:hypothetical protein n=1 Tax=Polynucleobacter sp. Latsch14-2 TaxID=2576920 RepID=UPI001C0D52D1